MLSVLYNHPLATAAAVSLAAFGVAVWALGWEWSR